VTDVTGEFRRSSRRPVGRAGGRRRVAGAGPAPRRAVRGGDADADARL